MFNTTYVFPTCPYLPSPSLQFGQEQATRRSLLLGRPSWSEELWTEPSWSGLIDDPDATFPTATTSNGEGNTLHLNPRRAQPRDADSLYPRPWVDLGCAQRQRCSTQGDQPSTPHCRPTGHRGQCQLLWHGGPQSTLQGDPAGKLQCLPGDLPRGGQGWSTDKDLGGVLEGLDGLQGLSWGQLDGLNVLLLTLGLTLRLQLDLLHKLVPHLAHDHLLNASCRIYLVLQPVGLVLVLRVCLIVLHLGVSWSTL
ncbi:hypothetical protein F7725_024979 [Dissostichus mawsoni]|uniref:Uncharacterized protein n=1 Tax=Dissostichus mawsoni TaxID=36200 RepID=A0A7J5X9U8_DISMA|nr:hypothetical protein F7725_024979 [Dissostichus mawsoni]